MVNPRVYCQMLLEKRINYANYSALGLEVTFVARLTKLLSGVFVHDA